jgi:hypothetical protein
MSRSNNAKHSRSAIPADACSDDVQGALRGREAQGVVELSDNEVDQISGGANILSILSGWGKTINPFDGTVGGSDDWGKTVDPFND